MRVGITLTKMIDLSAPISWYEAPTAPRRSRSSEERKLRHASTTNVAAHIRIDVSQKYEVFPEFTIYRVVGSNGAANMKGCNKLRHPCH